jgi:hypothetical protein
MNLLRDDPFLIPFAIVSLVSLGLAISNISYSEEVDKIHKDLVRVTQERQGTEALDACVTELLRKGGQP